MKSVGTRYPYDEFRTGIWFQIAFKEIILSLQWSEIKKLNVEGNGKRIFVLSPVTCSFRVECLSSYQRQVTFAIDHIFVHRILSWQEETRQKE